MGLDHSFVDKKHAKKNIAASMESVAEAVDRDVDNEKREYFHELLRSYTDILSKNLSTDYTYNNLNRLIKDESIVVIPGDKDSSIVIMYKNDYVKKNARNDRQRNIRWSLCKNRTPHLTRFKAFSRFLT